MPAAWGALGVLERPRAAGPLERLSSPAGLGVNDTIAEDCLRASGASARLSTDYWI